MRIVLLTFLCFSTLAAEEIQLDQLEESIGLNKSNLDIIWVLLAAALVMFMQAGFMCLESGMSRAKNNINVCVKNMADFCLAVSFFWLIGFGFMFGMSNGFVGTTEYALSFNDESMYMVALFFVFQAVFCGTAATITSGAAAERMRFGAYLVVSAIISVLIYPVFGHWAWSSLLHGDNLGWLEAKGFYDFAGSTVVHSTGAWVALAAIIVVGPRLGKFDENGKPKKIHAHNLNLVFLGTFVLFFGWFGFNCGSTGEASGLVAPIALNTILSACFGGIAATVVSWIFDGRPEPETMANGVLGGLVAITAGCDVMTTGGAVMVGLSAGVILYASTWFLEHICKVDDVVGAIPVHGFCGAWGTLCVAFFAIDPDTASASTQLLGIVTCFAYAFGVTFVLLKIIDMFIPLRVDSDHEEKGLNVSEHGATNSLWELAKTMHEISHGDDEAKKILRAKVEHGTAIGDLAIMFNGMLDSINEHESQLTDRLKSSSLFFDFLRQQMQTVQTLIKDLESDFEWTMSNASSVASSIQEVEQATEIIDQNFAQVSSQVRNGAEISEKNIKDITGAIDSLAFQSSMLSINASVEAARAGENGKGFAVVAEEVGRLAADTKGAAGNVSTQIEELGGVLQNAVHTITEEAKHIEDIGKSAHQSNDQIVQVVAKINKLKLGFEQMVGHMQQIFEHYAEQNRQHELMETAARKAISLQR